MTTRAEAKEQTREALLQAAREALSEEGAAAMSMRSVAARAGIVPSAVYRHVSSRDDLLTELIIESYALLADVLTSSRGGWRGAADALRRWALEHPHRFQLLYGTPVVGYQAPDRTIPGATAVATVFLERGIEHRIQDEAVTQQLQDSAASLGVDAEVLAATLADLSQLIGLILLELGGHFVGTADPAEHLWGAVLDRLDG